jgi:putative tricarboxylic transport membrane protein
MIDMLVHGFQLVLTPSGILACFVGVLVGTLVGILPGIGPSGTMALMLPFTLSMDTTAGLIMLAGVYYGAQYGGSTTSILVNVPGEASSVMTCMEGFQMAKRGRAGAALAVAAIGSWIAGTAGVIGLMLVGPIFAKWALAFGPPEIFAIMILGFVVISNISSKAPLKTTAMVLIGLMLGTVGQDPVQGVIRFTFGYPPALDGIAFIPVVMGLFGITEVLWSVLEGAQGETIAQVRFRDLYPTREEMKRSAAPIARGTILGFLVGLIPGPSAVIATIVSYATEKRLSKHPEDWGKGAIEGVAGPEASNNAASSGALIPLLVIGLPFAPPTAVLLSGFMMKGVIPGPLMFVQTPEIFWGIIASMYIGNVMLLVLNLPLVGVFASLLRVKPYYLMPFVVLLCMIGSYSLNNSMFDVWLMVVMGVVGYFMRKNGFDTAPLVIGLVLGQVAERAFRQSLVMLYGNVWSIFERPVVAVTLLLAVLIIVVPPVARFLRAKG